MNSLNKGFMVEDFLKMCIKNTQWENLVFACGGYVRDQLLGIESKDLDIVVCSSNGGIEFAEWITKYIRNYKQDSNPVIFPKFGTAKFHLNNVIHNNVSLDGYEIEAVMPRTEIYTLGSRKPDVKPASLYEDVLRRDITFNALYKNISTGEIIDLSGKGINDLKNKIIRTPTDPDITFTDDPLRMLRLIRFYAKFGYSIPLYIIRSIKRNAKNIETISSERIRDEINKMLMTDNPDKAFRLLKITGLLKYIIPEFEESYNMIQNKHHHEVVFDHILSVVKNTNSKILTVRLQALFHDIGKVKTRTVVDEKVHFYKHEFASAEMTQEIMTRLKYSNDEIDAVVLGVKNHMRLKSAGHDGNNVSDKALRKFIFDMNDQLDNILNLMHADNLAHAPGSDMPDQIPNIYKRIQELKTSTPVKGNKLPINGDDLKEMGISPGPIYKELFDLIRDKQLEFPNTTKEEYIKIVNNYINIS